MLSVSTLFSSKYIKTARVRHANTLLNAVRSNKSHSMVCWRGFSVSNQTGEQSKDQQEILVYTGIFAGKMKWLRRISLGSTVLSVVFFPAAATIQSGILPMAAQMALAGTVFFTSFSSTLLLQVVAHPYVCTLHEVVTLGTPDSVRYATEANSDSSSESENEVPKPSTEAPADPTSELSLNRRFKAMRYNMFGQPLVTDFTLRQADRAVSNPFSSFQVKPAGFFYVYGGDMKDTVMRRALTKEL